MYSSLPLRTGAPEKLTAEFLSIVGTGRLNLKTENLVNPDILIEEQILAVHFANTGAQGEGGAVEILYNSPQGISVLHGNYAYGGLNLNALLLLLPVLRVFDCRYRLTPPHHFKVPDYWGYMYMGAMNHFIARQEICDKTSGFVEYLMNNGGRNWQIFDAVSWLYGAEYSIEPRQFK